MSEKLAREKPFGRRSNAKISPSAFDSSNDALHPEKDAAAKRAVLLRLIRMTFFVIFFTVAVLSYQGITLATKEDPNPQPIQGAIAVITSAGLAIAVGLIDYLTPRKKISTISAVFFGLIAAMLATLALSYVIDLLVKLYDIKFVSLVVVIKALIGIALAYLSITTVLQTQDDFRLVIPYVEFAKQLRGTRPILLDTSALIDARIIDIGATGILQAPLVIPRFVIGELQQLADSQDGLKRGRGRRGLDVIAKLQRAARLDVSIDESPIPGKAVDQMLVELARQMSAMIMTNDVALARVAGIQEVEIVNINELANALKPSVIPGERLGVRLIRQGEQKGQAVGYLADGTMVVAEDGFPSIGQNVEVTVTSTLQTNAGRLIFARVHEENGADLETTLAAISEPGVPAPSIAPESSRPVLPPPAETGQAAAPAVASTDRARGPFPPNAPKSIRAGTPRNPRR